MQTCKLCAPYVEDGTQDPCGGALGLCVVAALRMLHDPARVMNGEQLQRYVLHAELDGEIAEFCALLIQAIFAISEGSEFVTDYLDMAEAVAASPKEHALVAETRIACDWLKTNLASETGCIQTTLVHDCHAAALWNNLLIALHRPAESETGIGERRDPRAA